MTLILLKLKESKVLFSTENGDNICPQKKLNNFSGIKLLFFSIMQ